MTVRATYRLQFNTSFTFADAEAIIPYLDALGVSHIYASPITRAQPGSMHGYDVADPTRVSPELGGEDALRSLVAGLRAHGMGLIIDIVPNHMGVVGGANGWWAEVLREGRESRYARFFDIDWSEKLMLPFLGEPLEAALANGDLILSFRDGRPGVSAYGSHFFPLRDEDEEEARSLEGKPPPPDLLERQHWRLAWWRAADDALNWRRFFTVSELAGLRIEDEAVFEATHQLYFRLYREGLIDGLRIDHVDGLADPGAYCRKLRHRLDTLQEERPAELRTPPWLVVEKILARGEALPPGWEVDGTSGYDFMEDISALLHDPAGQAPLDALWAQISRRSDSFEEEELRARRELLAWHFEGQLAAAVRAFAALAASSPKTRGLTGGMLRRALERLLWAFPAYRTYGTGMDAPPTDAWIRDKARRAALPLAAPGESGVVETVLAWLAGTGPGDPALAAEAVRRFQQLSAPIAAKAVEDTAFYRYGRLLSRNDVGFDPGRFAMAIEAFHDAMARRSTDWPDAMLATATHDHKRGEDVRARLAVLSEVPSIWRKAVEGWNRLQPVRDSIVAPDDVYQLYQTLFGAWPAAGATDDFRERIAAWQEKALREAKLRSSWTAPDEAYEAAARALLGRLLAEPVFVEAMAGLVGRFRPAAEANSLVQAFLRCTLPGVPDLYQGSEYGDFSLVDPDNRRPVDFAAREASLREAGDGLDGRKQALIARLLDARRDQPRLWSRGDYRPLAVEGERSGNVIAFEQHHGGRRMVAAAAIRCAAARIEARAMQPSAEWWGGTAVETAAGRQNAADLFADSPVHLAIC